MSKKAPKDSTQKVSHEDMVVLLEEQSRRYKKYGVKMSLRNLISYAINHTYKGAK